MRPHSRPPSSLPRLRGPPPQKAPALQPCRPTGGRGRAWWPKAARPCAASPGTSLGEGGSLGGGVSARESFLRNTPLLLRRYFLVEPSSDSKPKPLPRSGPIPSLRSLRSLREEFPVCLRQFMGRGAEPPGGDGRPERGFSGPVLLCSVPLSVSLSAIATADASPRENLSSEILPSCFEDISRSNPSDSEPTAPPC